VRTEHGGTAVGERTVQAYSGTRFPDDLWMDREAFRANETPAGPEEFLLYSVRFRPAGGQVIRIRIYPPPNHPGASETLRNLWFVQRMETDAISMIAFSDARQPAGSVHDVANVAGLGATTAQQVGAIRWWFPNGYVDQVYVAPDARRLGVGTALIHAASAVRIARNWPRLRGGPQRTVMGERLVQATPGWHIEAQTHVLPPMTPSET
jgi:GNAT superfamily N-acetyltransferase